jgi:hypothetical protein
MSTEACFSLDCGTWPHKVYTETAIGQVIEAAGSGKQQLRCTDTIHTLNMASAAGRKSDVLTKANLYRLGDCRVLHTVAAAKVCSMWSGA